MTHKDIELRDWYAGLAMQVILTEGLKEGDLHGEDFMADVVFDAFAMARYMMNQREYEEHLS